MGLPSSIARSTSMVWTLLVSGARFVWQWATFSWMSELVTGDAEGLTEHAEDVLFKGESKIANIKEFRISGSKLPVRRALAKELCCNASHQLYKKPCRMMQLQVHTRAAQRTHLNFLSKQSSHIWDVPLAGLWLGPAEIPGTNIQD